MHFLALCGLIPCRIKLFFLFLFDVFTSRIFLFSFLLIDIYYMSECAADNKNLFSKYALIVPRNCLLYHNCRVNNYCVALFPHEKNRRGAVLILLYFYFIPPFIDGWLSQTSFSYTVGFFAVRVLQSPLLDNVFL